MGRRLRAAGVLYETDHAGLSGGHLRSVMVRAAKDGDSIWSRFGGPGSGSRALAQHGYGRAVYFQHGIRQYAAVLIGQAVPAPEIRSAIGRTAGAGGRRGIPAGYALAGTRVVCVPGTRSR